MKKIILLFVLFITICAPVNKNSENAEINNSFSSIFKLDSADSLWVEKEFSELTLREKCAQLIFASVRSKDIDTSSKYYEKIASYITEHKIGGIIYSVGKIDEQVMLTNNLQRLSDIPLMIAADYERGLGMRLSDAVEFPYNMAFAAAGDTRLSYLAGKMTAIKGRAIGVHQNYAPVVDVNHDYKNPIINVRAYSEDPLEIAYHSIAYIRGVQEGSMIASVKHFPGHGATDLDSHKELPVISSTVQEFEKSDLVPFNMAVKFGVKSFMIGHLSVPAYEKTEGMPATFSKKIVKNLLREKMGFEGLVVTDAMSMKAIVDNFSTYEAMKLAVEAGNDIIIFPPDVEEAIDALDSAVTVNDLDEELINNSVKRILAAKKWLGLDKKQYIDTADVNTIVVNSVDDKRLAEEIAQKSITLVKDENNLIPVNPEDYYKTSCIFLTDKTTAYKDDEVIPFDKILRENFNYIKTHKLILKDKKQSFNKAYGDAQNSDLILLPVFLTVKSFEGTVDLDSIYVEFINKILKLNKPTILINFGNPYLLADVPEVPTYVCAYGRVDISQKAAVDALLGRINIMGRLPVSIPNTEYKYKSGIGKRRNSLFFQKADADTNYDFSRVEDIMQRGIEDSVFPGAVALVAQRGKVIFRKAFGNYNYDKNSEEITLESMFDVASLTKVLGTTSAAMILYDKGSLDLDEYVKTYLPEFGVNGKGEVKVRNLLLHNSGLTAYKPYYKYLPDGESVLQDIMNSKLNFHPGEEFVYSDLGMITLQKIIEKISGETLDVFLKKNLFDPLHLERIMYNPPAEYQYFCVPTEVDNYWRHVALKGKVHDETSYLLNGVAGHAGLFSTVSDAAVIVDVLMNKGLFNGRQIFNSKTVEEWTTVQSEQSTRGLGWDTKSMKKSTAGTKFSKNSFGHTGFTGTSIWADKERDLFVILFTNRVNPTRDNRKIIKFRPALHDAVIDAVDYF